MKILAVSDIHGDFDRFHPDALPEADLLLCAGDLTDVGFRRPREIAEASYWLTALAEKYPVFWVCGNHDIGFKADTFAGLHPRVQNILDQTVRFDGFSLHGVSCSPAYNAPFLVDDWDYMTADEAEEARAYDFEAVDIVLSHSPPYGCEPRLDYTGYVNSRGATFIGSFIGSRALSRYIERHSPRLVVCGHVHEATGHATLGTTEVVNVAQTWRVLEL